MLLSTSETGGWGYRRTLELEREARLKSNHPFNNEFFFYHLRFFALFCSLIHTWQSHQDERAERGVGEKKNRIEVQEKRVGRKEWGKKGKNKKEEAETGGSR